MPSDMETHEFAQQWIAAWNSHDLEAILAHYAENVTLTSPVAAKLSNNASGIVSGKKALRDYFARGLAAYPDLRFQLLDVLCGISSVVLYYTNQKGSKTGEFMEFDDDDKVVRVVANYSAAI